MRTGLDHRFGHPSGPLVGIKVHAWINIFLIANVERLPRTKDHPIYKHPDWVMVPRGVAADLDGLFVTPAHPEVKDNLYNIWMDVATKYEVDGLHFD